MDGVLGTFGRKLLILAAQVLIIVGAFAGSFLLRFDLTIPEPFLPAFFWLILPLVLIKLIVFWGLGLFSGWWRYISIPDLMVVLRANAFGSLAFAPVALATHQIASFPRSVLILDAILCFLLMGGMRVGVRVLREELEQRRKGSRNLQEVLIVGAGAVGQTFVREIRQNPHLNMSVLGFVDGDPQRQSLKFLGVPVLGTPSMLAAILRQHRLDQVIVAQTAVDPPTLKNIVETCQRAGVRSKILPAVGTILNGDVSIRQIRDVQLEDLLGRPPVQLDIQGIRDYLHGRRILVTGAGGSIGSEICRQVAAFAPDRLILLDHAETPLFHIEQELRHHFPTLPLAPCLADVRDRSGIQALFALYRPEVVFHAAAYKHVPMSECNPVEAVRNNVFGTRNVADCANRHGVLKFVMVSTDKAVNPTNAMGASKRAAEIYVQSLAARSSTPLVTVRFGNVLGSNGSVVPTFRQQIERGGPVTVTHPEVTRYFMTIPEAVQLVLQAGSMGQGGEIFLLDMGEPVKIVKLAEEMIRLSGLRLKEDIEIVFTGLRPGEKLYEELLLAGEGILPTPHCKIKVARSTPCEPALLERQLERLFQLLRQRDAIRIFQTLQEIVPEYVTTGGKAGGDAIAAPAIAKVLHLKVVPR
ncbi:MAG: polysaccharide biosynthesis protein [Desulfuromonadales bacterium]|nr:polysaccharide biosynthesis protein [Desulfuromonadales bacterium]